MVEYIKSQFLDRELAILARDKGFDEPCLGFYDNDPGIAIYFPASVFYPDYKNSQFATMQSNNPKVSAPLYQQVINWLEDTREILIHHSIIIEGELKVYGWTVEKREPYKIIQGSFVYPSREKALNRAIEQALLLIA